MNEKSTIPGDYNTAPPGLEPVTREEFNSIMFQYIMKKHESRQIHHRSDGSRFPYRGNILLFEVSYPGWAGMGVGMSHDEFFIFGEPDRWQTLERKFRNQFAGDNS